MPRKLPDWDEDSPQLEANLRAVMNLIRREAEHRTKLTVEHARKWHMIIMHGLQADDPSYVGAFRGEKGLEDVCVGVGLLSGSEPEDVADEPTAFENQLEAAIDRLDVLIAPGARVADVDQLAEVLRVCAWAHAEWVRIHPFANGNGRTARFWANCIALRYRVPAFVQLRPRPDGEYAAAAREAMKGNGAATERVFHQLYLEHIKKLRK
jgi:fido (protein-threonine AMPylation protein)